MRFIKRFIKTVKKKKNLRKDMGQCCAFKRCHKELLALQGGDYQVGERLSRTVYEHVPALSAVNMTYITLPKMFIHHTLTHI